jgi:hypothetical protein
MIDVDVVGAAIVAALRTIPEVLAACSSVPENIYLYQHQYPTEVSLGKQIYALKPNQVMVAWRGTQPAGRGQMTEWKHRFDVFLKPGREPAISGGQFFRLLVRGVPAGQLLSFLNYSPTSNVEPMDVPSVQVVSSPEGQDYFAVSLVYSEIGDE